MSLHQNLKDARAELTGPEGVFAITEIELQGHKMKGFALAPPSMRDIWGLIMARPDNEYLVFEDERWTYAQAHQEVCSITNWLSAQGVKPGDHVAIAMRNYPEWVTAYWAILSMGAVCVGFNAWWVGDEMAYALNDCKPKVLICDDKRLAAFEQIRSKFPDIKVVGVRVGKDIDGVTPFEELRTFGGEMSSNEIDTDDVACIFYTSGTTGRPKGAQLTHRSCITNLMNFIVGQRSIDMAVARTNGTEDELPAIGEGPAPHILITTPMFHVTANNCAMQPGSLVGGKLVFMHKWDAGTALKVIEAEKITSVTGVPVMSRELLSHPDFAKSDTSSLLAVGGGGSAFQPDLIKDIDKKISTAQPATGYGLTEVSGVLAGISKDFCVLHPTTVGPVTVTNDIKIIDASGAEVAQGERGEVCVRGPNVIKGYLNRPEETAEAIRDSWFYTGDVGYLDEHEFLYIVDRIKDMLIRGGENVYASEVETVLYENTDIAECAVFGVPDDRLGEEVGVAIYLKPNVQTTADDIRDKCRDLMAAYKIPRYIWLIAGNLPRNASGKIVKTGMAKAYKIEDAV